MDSSKRRKLNAFQSLIRADYRRCFEQLILTEAVAYNIVVLEEQADWERIFLDFGESIQRVRFYDDESMEISFLVAAKEEVDAREGVRSVENLEWRTIADPHREVVAQHRASILVFLTMVVSRLEAQWAPLRIPPMDQGEETMQPVVTLANLHCILGLCENNLFLVSCNWFGFLFS